MATVQPTNLTTSASPSNMTASAQTVKCMHGGNPEDVQRLYISLCAIFACFAVIGNGLIILAVLIDPKKRLRTPFSYFLVNLCISDFLCGLVAMPLTSYLHYRKLTRRAPASLHTVIHIVTFMCSLASLFSLVALCVDRYICIKWPLKRRVLLSVERCVWISIGIWMSSIGLSLLYLHVGFEWFQLGYLSIALVVAMPILLLTSYNAIRVMREKVKHIDKLHASSYGGKSGQGDRTRLAESKVTKVFLVILTVFVLTYIPATAMAYALKAVARSNCVAKQWLKTVVMLLVLANSFVNPAVCMTQLKRYRASFVYVLRSGVPCMPVSSTRQRDSSKHDQRQSQREKGIGSYENKATAMTSETE